MTRGFPNSLTGKGLLLPKVQYAGRLARATSLARECGEEDLHRLSFLLGRRDISQCYFSRPDWKRESAREIQALEERG
jgi:hypothetical protein